MSEWTVIMACKEMRQKGATWYSESGEVVALIRAMQDGVDALLRVDRSRAPVAIFDDGRAGKRFAEVPRDRWLDCHYVQRLAHADRMLSHYRHGGLIRARRRPRNLDWQEL